MEQRDAETNPELRRANADMKEFYGSISFDRPLTDEERKRGEAENAAELAELGIDPDDE